MKVIYLHQYFNTPKMSGGVRSYDIAKHLVDCGHSVEMITTERSLLNFKGWKISNENGIRTHWISLFYSNKLNFYKRIRSFFMFAYKASKRGCSLQGDIVFATSTPLTVAIPALYISWKKSIPLVFEVRDLWPDIPIALGVIKNPLVKRLVKFLEKYTYKKSRAIIALSTGMKNGIIRTGCNPAKVVVVPNFSNMSLFNSKTNGKKFRSQRKWLQNSPLLVYTGAFGVVNGLGYLVDIAEQLVILKSDIKILLVGDGKEHNNIVSKAKSKNVLNKNFFIESSISKSELPELLAAADLASNIVINIPEMWDNSANKFFDALASGTPILINSGGWQEELINKEKIGISTYGLSLEQSAIEIDKLMHDKKKLRSLSKNALTISSKYYNKDMLVEKIRQVMLSATK